MNDGGKHYVLSSYVCTKISLDPGFLGLKFSISTVKYLMSIFVCLYHFQGCRLYVICKQDFDNSRGIGFQEVCVTYLQVVRILSVYNAV
jgi:hypothetical protein